MYCRSKMRTTYKRLTLSHKLLSCCLFVNTVLKQAELLARLYRLEALTKHQLQIKGLNWVWQLSRNDSQNARF